MNKTLFLISDRHQSVLRVAQDAFAYTPHGHSGEASRGGRPGFAGELREALTGHYLLGSGYRAYNPVLMRFHSPDSWSPFGRGGVNAYAYCLGDPVNRVDPSGHFSWRSMAGLVGIGLSALLLGAATPLALTGLVLGGASTTIDIAQAELGASQGSTSGLRWVGITLGVMAMGVGVSVGVGVLRRTRSMSELGPPSSATPMGMFGRLEGTPEIFQKIVRYVPGDDLVNLAATSRTMHDWVRFGMKRLPVLPDASALTKPVRDHLRAIALGKAPGHPPGQVAGWRNLEDMARIAMPAHDMQEIHKAIEFTRHLNRRRQAASVIRQT